MMKKEEPPTNAQKHLLASLGAGQARTKAEAQAMIDERLGGYRGVYARGREHELERRRNAKRPH